MFEQRLYRHLDWSLLAAVVTLCLMGLVMIYSTTYDPIRDRVGREFYTQLSAMGIGLAVMTCVLFIDYRTLTGYAPVVYGAVAVLLLYVLYFGVVAGGSRRWISLVAFNLQPSEFAKAGLALLLASWFGQEKLSALRLGDLAAAGGLLFLLFLLIARQPDLGSAMTLLPVLGGIAYAAGLRLKLIGYAVLLCVLLAPVAWFYGLQEYQKSRVVTFLDPSQDARGAGYQQIQARITVGSGGLAGKGFLNGTQGQYKFLPVAHNDFVYSVLAEEHGFIGVLATLGLYLFVLIRSLDAARLARDRIGAYLVVGLVSCFAFQVIYNIAMSAGLAPVKGLTLPLMSYGGSSIIATLMSFGLILNVRMRRFAN
ncbi:MAG: rod shape-determining protein RodA [Acidobacteria bacterium]|nr:rod shape-determining protein RodA [Acidobacteriota bacterium]